MYNKVLEEKTVAGDIIDRLREYTNAPLSSCIDAARAVIDGMADYVSDESFLRIASAIHSFEIDINNSRDKKVLDLLVKQLLEIFREKEELSYSTSQDDELLISSLKHFVDIVSKTDSRITYSAVSFDDFTFLNSLINLFQMAVVSSCFDALTESCPRLAVFFMESKLPVMLTLSIASPSKPLTKTNVSSIVILTRIFSCTGSPPLSHFGSKLKLLKNLCKSVILFEDIFYTNDIVVLKHVLARELVNNEDATIRRLCLDVIVELKNEGVGCDDIEEIMDLSSVNLV